MVKIAGSREKWGEPGFSLSSALDSCGILSLSFSKVRMTVTEMSSKHVRIILGHVRQAFSADPNLEVLIKCQLGIRGGRWPDGAGGLQGPNLQDL